MNEALAWGIMREHYKTLYYGSPGFRENVNFRAATFTQIMWGPDAWGKWSSRLTKRREDYIQKQHEKGVEALQAVVQEIRRQRPALAAEERHKAAQPVLRTRSREEERFIRTLLVDMQTHKEAVRQNWYRKNREKLGKM